MFKFINNYLKKISEQNKKCFGTSKLDCCDLNKINIPIKKANNKNMKKNDVL